MRRIATAAAVLGSGFVLLVACSSSEERPKASGDTEGGVFEGGTSTKDSGDASKEVPASCRDTMKSEKETDVDCGGEDCNPCALGKVCDAKTDCSDAAECENKLCALCHDNATNGDESDVDCGGKACGACTVGKRCKVAEDCRSGACINDACACPKDMTIIALAGGGAYCIDQSEVSKGQYNKFITANVPVTDQAGACLATNDTFIPRGAWPPAEAPGPLEFNLGLPVHYVDWCDAVSYCKWAKKQLCGTINGAELAVDDFDKAAKSAWYNACSAQGTKTYPYGAVPYDQQRCNGDGAGTAGVATQVDDRASGFGYTLNEDDGVYTVAVSDKAGTIMEPAHKACQGGSVGVYQMSGNVAEWENACDDTTATSPCRVRGGSSADGNNGTALRCDANRKVVRMPPSKDALKDIGIRCCIY